MRVNRNIWKTISRHSRASGNPDGIILDPRFRGGDTLGFTLVEVMVTSVVVGVVMIGLIWVFISCAMLTDVTGNKSKLLAQAQAKIEEMRNHDFSALAADYASGGTPGNTFATTQPNGMGVIYMDVSNPSLIIVNLYISFTNHNGRITGSDFNLDGVADAGEAVNGSGHLTSPISISTIIGNRG